ncbi:uncharacterized protein [Epargyreus clarus]|uniref:uncharacterized protein isoform X2 n=1 Tax=Epargyreus clarus TaxID=520877 RepID=UPI003C308C58
MDVLWFKDRLYKIFSQVYPPDCLICDHCVRQLRNIDRFRTLVHAAFAKQRSDYSSKHSQLGTGEGFHPRETNVTVNQCADVKLRKRSKTILPKRRELRRDRRSSVSTSLVVKRMNIACIMCKQRYPMIVPFEGWKEFICSRCKKNREVKSVKRNSSKMAPNVNRDRMAFTSKTDLRGRSRPCCLSKKSTQLSKIEVTSRTLQQKYQCSLCPKKYVVAQHLTHHMTTVHGRPGQNLVCNVCSKGLRSKESLEKHARTHTGQPVYQCDVCLRTFKGKRFFQAHYLTHGK